MAQTQEHDQCAPSPDMAHHDKTADASSPAAQANATATSTPTPLDAFATPHATSMPASPGAEQARPEHPLGDVVLHNNVANGSEESARVMRGAAAPARYPHYMKPKDPEAEELRRVMSQPGRPHIRMRKFWDTRSVIFYLCLCASLYVFWSSDVWCMCNMQQPPWLMWHMMYA
jgi:hypothetical protein